MSDAARSFGADARKDLGAVQPGFVALWRKSVVFQRDFAAYASADGARAALLVALGTALDNAGAVFLIPLVAMTTGEGADAGRVGQAAAALFDVFGAESRLSRLSLLLALFCALMIVRAIVQSRRGRLLSRLRTGFVQSLRVRVLRRLAAARWDSLVGLRHARVSHVLGGDIDRIGMATYVGVDCLVAAVTLAGQSALAFALAPVFTAFSLTFLGAATLAVAWLLRRGYELGGETTRGNLALMHSVGQLLGGLKLAMSQNLQTRFVDEFETTIDGIARRAVEFANQQADGQLAFSTLAALAAALCAYVGIGVMEMPAAIILPLLVILSRMSAPAIAITRNVQQFLNCLPAYERLRELENELAPSTAAPATTAPRPAPEGAVSFSGVTFVHSDSTAATSAGSGVRDLDLAIEPGEIVGVTGASGAGKTTFADLLVGLNAPQSGVVAVGGEELSGAALAAWRETISYVSQDPFLFQDSVRRNLLWARRDADEAEIWRALALAGADDVVRRMPNGLDAALGERGVTVSGGERQRIALARAILRRPRLLVLDEATSALDIASENLVLSRLPLLEPKPTIVIISHRPESLAMCGRVLEFRAGRLVRNETRQGAAQ
jgi:ATP-binding cassette subfamily C protein